MEEKRRKCIVWIKEHSQELLLAGISVGAIILMFLSLKNCVMMEEKLEELKDLITQESKELEKMSAENLFETADKVCTTHAPHCVKMHIRNLPMGKKPSPEKIALAIELGYELLPNQTLVEAYSTGELAA